MVDVPQRPGIARSYRWLLAVLEERLQGLWPKLNPSWYQLAGLLLSGASLFFDSFAARAAAVAVVLFLDWLDGAAARALKLAGRQGWMLDVLIDRLSEVFLFLPEIFRPHGWLWLAAALINIGLSEYSVVSGKHRILPLRFFYLLVLIYRMAL